MSDLLEILKWVCVAVVGGGGLILLICWLAFRKELAAENAEHKDRVRRGLF